MLMYVLVKYSTLLYVYIIQLQEEKQVFDVVAFLKL